jgi:hypothetical protein
VCYPTELNDLAQVFLASEFRLAGLFAGRRQAMRPTPRERGSKWWLCTDLWPNGDIGVSGALSRRVESRVASSGPNQGGDVSCYSCRRNPQPEGTD